MFLRITLILQTIALFAAPVTAGLLLSVPSRQPLHSAAAYTVFAVAVLQLVASVVAWRPGGGSPKPIMHAAGFLVLVSAQVALGIAHVTTLHVPLGVLLFTGSVLQLSRVWTPRSSERVSRTPSSV
ncbi:hypothetical protein ACIBIZ_01225 [Nonomuraea spiralis]|uniref:Uncharacterized protein n=1 Tax=Nonomuraea spiralis TaxID=46182 RepID=A0ABV5IQR0_9ACTN|nr:MULTISPECIES: hypothetical protein [Nonomuraea]RSN00207.1 hypothetical protein DMB42_40490 [Nonomuraea sp. WAC 01424]GGT15114.1 hypothetical protein GCM10010176_069700 [Nonomuraea spiralis]